MPAPGVENTASAIFSAQPSVTMLSLLSRMTSSPVDAPSPLFAPNNRIAILFGREANGLTNDELHKCHCHLQIPAHPDYPSLNLAMAVQVVSYELFKQANRGQPVVDVWDRAPATAEQVEGLMTHLETVLISIGFLDPANPGQSLTRLRRLFNRIQPDETEVQMLRGVLNHLGKGNSGPN